VATLDSMGVIDIRDRIKDVIKTGGEWISSLALEDLISRHPAVREVAVVGIPDPQWGERPFALLVVREGHAIEARELKEHLKPFVELGHLSKWAIPSQIALVTEIPKTSVGKLDKKRIRVDITEWQANNSTFLSTLYASFAVPERARQAHQASAWLVKSIFSAILSGPASAGLAKGLFQSGRRCKSHFRGIKQYYLLAIVRPRIFKNGAHAQNTAMQL
jgi:hypothetical protein